METQVVHAFTMPVQNASPEAQGFRQFVVEHEDGVDLPGCKAIEEIRLDGLPIPAYEDHKVPTDSTHQNFKTLRLPNYAIVDGPRDCPVLLRGMNSNDGKWQVGRVIHVKGEWEDKTPAPKKTKADN